MCMLASPADSFIFLVSDQVSVGDLPAAQEINDRGLLAGGTFVKPFHVGKVDGAPQSVPVQLHDCSMVHAIQSIRVMQNACQYVQ